MNLVALGFTSANSGVFGASQTQKAQKYNRLPPQTPAQIDKFLPAPPFAMECPSGVLRSPGLLVTGPTLTISYPDLTCVLVLFQYLGRRRPQ